jgi:hypothetical protein
VGGERLILRAATPKPSKLSGGSDTAPVGLGLRFQVGRLQAANRTGWGIATLASVVSLFITARVDLPIGAAIVCALGAALVLVEIAVRCFRRT